MTRSLYDKGKTRQFYQILTAFIPGQTYNYSPNLGNERNPSLTVITTKISDVVLLDPEKEASIRYWSEGRILERITHLSGTQASNLNLIRLNYDPDTQIFIEFSIYPKTFIFHRDKSEIISWNFDIDNPEKEKQVTQAQFVFCNRTGVQGIHSFSIQGRNDVQLAFPNEENWKNQRILIEGNRYPLSASYTWDTNFDKARADFVKYSSDWRFRPILSSSRIVFTPIPFFDIFYPKIAGYKDIITYLLSLESITDEDIKGEGSFLGMVISWLDETKTSEELSKMLNNHNLVGKEKVIADKLIVAHKKAKTSEIKEKYKLYTLSQIPPVRKKEASENSYLRNYGISSISYLEPLECLEMCMGWVTGKVDPGVGEDQAILQRIRAKVDRKDILYDSKNNDWNILYDVIESEGILLNFDKSANFLERHTFSHLLLKVLPEFAGIDASMLSEEVFENENALLIYSREPGDFKTYGLKHVFDNSLQYLLESANDFSKCPFEDNDSGCYYCLHIPLGCDKFNGELSKASLLK